MRQQVPGAAAAKDAYRDAETWAQSLAQKRTPFQTLVQRRGAAQAATNSSTSSTQRGSASTNSSPTSGNCAPHIGVAGAREILRAQLRSLRTHSYRRGSAPGFAERWSRQEPRGPPGTNRCGRTLVYQLPVPAQSPARQRWPRALRHTPRIPGLHPRFIPPNRGCVSNSTCPTMVFTSFGCAGSAPRTSATILSGTVATGNTRPWAPSNAATQSNRQQGFRFLPTVRRSVGFRWRAPPSRQFRRSDAASPVTTFAPQASSPQSAARAMRRSREVATQFTGIRPLEPPSSATPTNRCHIVGQTPQCLE